MNKYIWLVIILAIIIIALTGILLWSAKPVNKNPVVSGIQIISPKLGAEVSSPLKITGIVNGNGWAGFEGQVGTVKLLDEKGKELATGILTATTEWTTLPTNFETTLNFSLATAQSGTLVFKNENASGDPVRDKTFSLPVKIGVSSGNSETIKVSAYFNNNKMDPEISCNKVFAVEREVPKTTAVARVALEELLKGPTQAEINQGFKTVINSGVKIQSLTIDSNGVAKADFSKELEVSGGSCLVSAIRAQITKTLEQFSTVKNVVISINGKTADILQP